MAYNNNKKQKDEETPTCVRCRREAVIKPQLLCTKCQKKVVENLWHKKIVL